MDAGRPDELEAGGSRAELTSLSKRRLWRSEICTEDDCDRVPIARNLCSMHYQRRKIAGTLPEKVRTRGRRDNPPEFQCGVPGCVVPAKSHGLCGRHYGRSRRYGLGFDELAELDKGACEVCDVTENLHVDHDHETGEVRGLLCQGCNTALGAVKDDLRRLVRLAAYLERNQS